MPSAGEASPLLPSTPDSTSRKYYFLNDENHQGGTTSAVRDSDGGEVYETIPEGASADEFAPRRVVVVGQSKEVRSVDYVYI